MIWPLRYLFDFGFEEQQKFRINIFIFNEISVRKIAAENRRCHHGLSDLLLRGEQLALTI